LTPHRARSLVLGGSLCALCCGTLWAQSVPDASPTAPAAAALDVRLLHARRVLRAAGPTSSFFGAATPDPASAAVLVTLRSPGACPALPTARWITRAADGPLERAGVCAGWLGWEALEALAARPTVRAVRWAGAPLLAWPAVAPLVTTQRDAAAVRTRVGGLDGEGVHIVDVDGPVDLLHPALFDSDGGAYAWVDVDLDGALTLRVDGVDLDGDGRISPRERLGLVDATRVPSAQQAAANDDGRFELGQDWLFVDRNADGRRNAGPLDGFQEDDLAYGEPIFVVDDIDADGVLDPGERLLRLGRSKLVAVVDGPLRYQRGVDLVRAALHVDDGAFHGTAVAGLMVGGQPRAHALSGSAPGADLEVHILREPAEVLVRVAAALDASTGAGVVSHEWSLPGELMDGGGALDAVIGEASQRAPQLVAAGNMHLAQRHVAARVEGTRSLVWSIPADVGALAQRVELVVQWMGPQDMQLALRGPSGAQVEAVEGSMGEAPWGQVAWSRERSTAGAQLWRAVLWVEQGQLEAGAWTLELRAAEPVEAWARVFDRGSPWERGVGWGAQGDVAQGTLVAPAAAPGALVMTALGGLEALADGSSAGELRAYAGRGPTLSGVMPLMLAAPDDAFSPLYLTPARADVGWGVGWYAPFGGTSGALAQGAGAMALVRQANPELDAAGLRARMMDAADTRALIPAPPSLPDVGWGAGRMDLAGALGGLESGRAAPLVRVEARLEGDELVLDASGCVDPDGGAVEVWVDVGYEGRAEIVWAAPGVWTLDRMLCGAEPCLVRVQVRDAQGQQAGALVVVGAPMEPVGMDPAPAPLDAEEGSCACGVAPGRAGGGPWWLGGVLGLWAWGRRRDQRRFTIWR
jgi:subtilisin family serine protease